MKPKLTSPIMKLLLSYPIFSVRTKLSASLFFLGTLFNYIQANPQEHTGTATSTKAKIEISEWSQTADSLQISIYKNYLGENGVFKQNNKNNNKFHYWWNAHMVDVLVDGYLRTNDDAYLPKLKALVRGIKTTNNNSYQIFYNDDMEWLGIACLRAYEATGDKEYKQVAEFLWEEVKKGWTNVHGGGIMWRTDTPEEKNACSNGPGALLALKLYSINKSPKELEWAKKIFEWQNNTLVDPLTGLVWDNISYQNEKAVINKELVLTYNQGTHIGAAMQLFTHTGDQQYLTAAWKTTKSLITSPKLTFEGVLRSEGQGDGGLFKGILVRYLTLLAESPAMSDEKKKELIGFLAYNANAFKTFGLNTKEMLAGPNWVKQPAYETDLSTQLSGVMLIEMAAKLNLPKVEVQRHCNDREVPLKSLPTKLKKEILIVVLGSSTAEGVGPANKENAWVPRFSKYLRKLDPKIKVMNLAKGGFQTTDILPEGDPEKNISKALSLDPDAIIINLPSNDAAQGHSAAEQLKNYQEILDSIRKDIPIWVTTPQPRNFEKSKVQIQLDMVDSTYSLIDDPFFIDLWTCFADEKGLLKPEYDSGDGIHLNDDAHLIIFKRVLESQGDFSHYIKSQN